jgi:DNA-binding protein HU-beta
MGFDDAVMKGDFALNRNDLISAVAGTSGLSKSDVTKAVDGVFAAITEALKSGDEVRLAGFGTFAVAERAASQGRNPRTGEPIDIPPSKQAKFKAGKQLKDALN